MKIHPRGAEQVWTLASSDGVVCIRFDGQPSGWHHFQALFHWARASIFDPGPLFNE